MVWFAFCRLLTSFARQIWQRYRQGCRPVLLICPSAKQKYLVPDVAEAFAQRK